MRRLLCVGLLCLVTVAVAGQNLQETYGKTHAQILAMGYDKWYAFFTGKEGESTHGMARSGYFYADALAWRNRDLLSKQPPTARDRYRRLEDLLKTFGSSVIEVQRALSGGGTIWQLTRSSDSIDVQETLYALLGSKSNPAKPMVVSKVRKELSQLARDVDNSPASTWQYEFTKAQTVADLKKATQSFEKIVQIAKVFDRRRSDHTLAYCARVMSNAQMGN